jgi:hypothetical protein
MTKSFSKFKSNKKLTPLPFTSFFVTHFVYNFRSVLINCDTQHSVFLNIPISNEMLMLLTYFSAECRLAKCCYTECRGAKLTSARTCSSEYCPTKVKNQF